MTDSMPTLMQHVERLPEPILRTIVAQVRDGHCLTPPNKVRAAWRVQHEGTTYKIRLYESAHAARQQLQLIDRVQHLVVPCYGQFDRHLVLAYLPHETLRLPDAAALGKYLAELDALRLPGAADPEFSAWCDAVEEAGVFRTPTMAMVRQLYALAQPRFSWGLEYLDAKPLNFAMLADGRVVTTDEKHLRMAPRGSCQMKPMLQMAPADFAALKTVYRDEIGWNGLDDPEYHRLLTIYYTVYILAFRLTGKSVTVNSRFKRFHQHRRNLLQALQAPWQVRVREELPWVARQWLVNSGDLMRGGLRAASRLGRHVAHRARKILNIGPRGDDHATD